MGDPGIEKSPVFLFSVSLFRHFSYARVFPSSLQFTSHALHLLVSTDQSLMLSQHDNKGTGV